MSADVKAKKLYYRIFRRPVGNIMGLRMPPSDKFDVEMMARNFIHIPHIMMPSCLHAHKTDMFCHFTSNVSRKQYGTTEKCWLSKIKVGHKEIIILFMSTGGKVWNPLATGTMRVWLAHEY